MNYRIHYSCVSHIGKCRSTNQDNFICGGRFLEEGKEPLPFPLNGCQSCGGSAVAGVFDGMGGEECGETAAWIAARCAAGISAEKDSLKELEDFCREANGQICDWAEKHGIQSMGTTAAILVFGKREIGLCNIGDSKIFRFTQNRLEQISVDHYAVGVYGRKPPLSQNLGIPEKELLIDPYLAVGTYSGGDVYLLCSDGLTDMVEREEIARTLMDVPFEEAAERLLHRALENGGRDNITILLCRVEREKESLLERLFGRNK